MSRKTLLALIALTGFTSPAAEPANHDTATGSETRANLPHIIVFGGTRGVGLEVVRLLEHRGDAVSVFLRPTSDRSGLEGLNVRILVGDALIQADVQSAFAAEQFTGVVSTLGCRKCDVPPDYIGNRNIIDAANATGVQHLILVSAIGAGDSADALPFFVKIFLRNRIKLKSQAEDYLRTSDLDFTIIRPGQLKNGEPTGQATLTTDPNVMGSVRRTDLARLMLEVLYDPDTFGITYSAYKPR